MRARVAISLSVVTAMLGGAVALTAVNATNPSADPDAYGLNEIARNGNVQGELYPGDPATEAALVQEEDERIVYVRRVASAAYWTLSVAGAYRFQTGDDYTLVLPSREAAYTLDDLRALSPDTLTENADGSYLLRGHVAVMQGATLALGGVELRLESSPDGFSSIVAIGGRLDFAGSEKNPAVVTSWDSTSNGRDTDTTDGRAYLRVIGGSATISHARLSSLGFWGGNTGGLAITGNDDADDATLAAAMVPSSETLAAPSGAPVVDPSALFDVPVAEPSSEPDEATLTSASPGADAASPREAIPEVGLSTATITDSTISGNAFGIFVSSAENVTVRDTSVHDSLVDGITLHRSVTSSTITDSDSSGNAVDGISLGRSTLGIALSDVTASRNGRNGVTMDGQSLADGPSAAGTAVESFGNNSIIGSTIAQNGRYGLEISGGSGIRVTDNLFSANPDGVVVTRGSEAVRIDGNEFVSQKATSVAVRDIVSNALVENNTIRGGDTGIYVRDAEANVTSNALTGLSNHAVSLVGDVTGTEVTDNALGGDGRTALRSEASIGAAIGENDVDQWRAAPTVDSVLAVVFQPLTMVWLLLGLLLLLTAVTRKDRQYGKIRDPYSERVPLTSLSQGVVTLDAAQKQVS